MWLNSLIIGLFLLILATVMKKYNLSILISGYNTAPKKVKEKYDEKNLILFVSRFILILSAIPIFSSVLAFVFSYAQQTIIFISWIIFVIVIFIGLIYLNVTKKVKR